MIAMFTRVMRMITRAGRCASDKALNDIHHVCGRMIEALVDSPGTGSFDLIPSMESRQIRVETSIRWSDMGQDCNSTAWLCQCFAFLGVTSTSGLQSAVSGRTTFVVCNTPKSRDELSTERERGVQLSG